MVKTVMMSMMMDCVFTGFASLDPIAKLHVRDREYEESTGRQEEHNVAHRKRLLGFLAAF